jgi:arylsulfatase A-like enzyme
VPPSIVLSDPSDPRIHDGGSGAPARAYSVCPGLRIAAGLFAAALVLAVADAAAIGFTLPLPRAGMGLRLALHLFDFAETLGVGAFAALVGGAFVSYLRPPAWAAVGVAVAITAGLVYLAIGENLTRLSSLTLDGRYENSLFAGYLGFLGVLLPAGYAVGGLFSRRPILRLLPLAFSLLVMAVDQLPARDDYQGIHGVVAWGAALLGGAAVAPLIERAGLALTESRKGRGALGAVGLFALLGVALPPPNAVRFELFRQPCAVAPWVLATAIWRAPGLHAAMAPPPPSEWLLDRAELPPVPPTAPPLLPSDAVIVLVTIDATRFDAVADPANDALLPAMAGLRRHGVFFTRAYAPGSQTTLSLATLFSGRYFSEQYWSDIGHGRTRYLYLPDDKSIRFPEVLLSRGVETVNFAGLIFLSNEFGVLRGFSEEKMTVKGIRHATARELIDPLLERLDRAGPGPLFIYTHLLEPHEPYDRGSRDGTPYERYLSEIAVADAQVGRLESHLREHFGFRWALFVSADHGEAFGEHGGFTHGKSLYEELIHVPLLARSPRFPHLRVDEPVSLIDLGPTILDLFGIETPPSFMGQSLVPFLEGRTAHLTRPLIAEGRLRRSLILPDGLKVIEDLRRKVVEVYDLSRDPGETRNLFDVEPARSDEALAALRAFFAAHTRTEGGYEVPFKP